MPVFCRLKTWQGNHLCAELPAGRIVSAGVELLDASRPPIIAHISQHLPGIFFLTPCTAEPTQIMLGPHKYRHTLLAMMASSPLEDQRITLSHPLTRRYLSAADSTRDNPVGWV